MGQFSLAILAWAVFTSTAAIAAEKPIPKAVVTTLPVLQDFVKQIGKEHVTVSSVINGSENSHSYSLKPSDVLAVHKADMFVMIGAGLEVWAEQLLQSSQNASLQIVVTSKGISLLKDTTTLHKHNKHILGDPHIWLDPENAKSMVRQITTRLIKIDRRNRKAYLNNQAEYLRALDSLQANIKARVKHLSDRKFIAHHAAWPYFARRFGFKISGNIIEQPGEEPSAKHLSQLTKKMKKNMIKVIVTEPQLNQKIPKILSNETGASIITLTVLPGALPGTSTYIDMLQYNVSKLANALDR